MKNKGIKTIAAAAIATTSLLSAVPAMAKEEVKEDQNIDLKDRLDVLETEKNVVEKEESAAKSEFVSAQNQLQNQKVQNDEWIIQNLQSQLDLIEKNEKALEEENKKLDSLSQQQKQYESDVKKSQEEQERLEAELKELEAQADSITSQQLEEARNNVTKANAEKQDLENKLTDLKAQKESQKEKIASIKAEITAKEAELDAKTAELEISFEEVEAALTRLDTLHKQLENADPNVAQEQYELAKQEAERLSNEALAKQEAVNEVQKALDEANDILSQMEGTLQELDDAIDLAQENVNACQSRVDAAVLEEAQALEQLKQDNSAYASLTKAIELKNAEIESVQNELKDKQALIAEKETKMSELEKMIASIESELNEVQQLTSKDFYQAIGDMDALTAFEKAGIHTDFNDPNDATSLNNMKIALQELKVLNQIRLSEGVREVKVTSAMMAQSQIQTNESAQTYEHSRIFNVGENLAFGFHPSMGSAYEAWYTYEKDLFNDLVSRTSELQDLRDRNFSDYEIGFYLTREQKSEVGHYLNTINPFYAYAGSSFNTKGWYTVGNVYDMNNYDGNKEYTIEEYEDLLDAYMSAHDKETLQKQLDQARSDLEKQRIVKEEYEAQKAEIEQRKSSLVHQRQGLEKEQEGLKLAVQVSEQNLAEKTAEKEALQSELNNLQTIVQNAVSKRDAFLQSDGYVQAKANAESLKVQYDAKVSEQKQVQDQQNLALQNLKDKEFILNNAQSERDRLQKEFDKEHENFMVLRQENDRLQLEVIDMCEKYEEARTRLKAEEQILLEMNEQIESLEGQVQNAEVNLNNAVTELNKLEDCIEGYAAKKQEVTDNQKKVDGLLESIETVRSNLLVSKRNVKDLTAERQILSDDYDVLKLAESAWHSVLCGGEDVLEGDLAICEMIEQYKVLRQSMQEKKAVFEEVKVRADKKRSEYAKAKKEYEMSLEAFNTFDSEKADVNTSVFTDAAALSALAAISLAGFTFSLKKRND